MFYKDVMENVYTPFSRHSEDVLYLNTQVEPAELKKTFKTVSGTLTPSKQVQFHYVKENTPQNDQTSVSLYSQTQVLKLLGKSNESIRIQNI